MLEKPKVGHLKCLQGCKKLHLAGVMTLDEEDHLEFFCDRCLLYQSGDLPTDFNEVRDLKGAP